METYRRVAILIAAAALVAGCGGKSKPTFAYDASKPLDLKTVGTRRQSGVEIRDISFSGPRGGRLDAFLVLPARAQRLPAVLYVHGAVGDRSELLGQAVRLARLGAVGLTLEMNYSPRRAKPVQSRGIDAVKESVANEIETVLEIRRAVDLLSSLPSVDRDRIGYAGWSAGARFGAIAAGVDHRIRAYDLLAGGALPLSEYLDAASKDLRAKLEPLLSKTDPLRYVGHAAPSALFFQDGRRDEIVPRSALLALARAGSRPKDLRWYASGHVPSDRAWADSRRWLLRELRG